MTSSESGSVQVAFCYLDVQRCLPRCCCTEAWTIVSAHTLRTMAANCRGRVDELTVINSYSTMSRGSHRCECGVTSFHVSVRVQWELI